MWWLLLEKVQGADGRWRILRGGAPLVGGPAFEREVDADAYLARAQAARPARDQARREQELAVSTATLREWFEFEVNERIGKGR